MAHIICATPFWNNNLTWYTDDPEFTDCFQKTVLTWIPFVFLCLVLPLEIYFCATRSVTHMLKNKRLFYVKVILLLLLLMTALVELGLAGRDLLGNISRITRTIPFQRVNLIPPITQLLGYALVMIFVVLDCRKQRRSSGSLFIFWILLACTEAISLQNMKHYLQVPDWEDGKIIFAIRIIRILLVLAQLICSGISAEIVHDDDYLKSILLLLLLMTALVELGLAGRDLLGNISRITRTIPFQRVNLIPPITQLLGYALVMIFVVLDCRKQRRSSGSLFIFWILLACTEAISLQNMKHYLQVPDWEDGKIIFAIRIIRILLVLAQLICSGISAEIVHDDDYLKSISSPEKTSSFLSQILFCWFSSMIYRGWRKPYVEDDIWDLNPPEKATIVSERFEKYIGHGSAKRTSPGNWISLSLFLCFWVQLGFTVLLKMIYNIMLFTVPEILGLLIGFVKDEHQEVWKGYLFAVLLLLATVVQTLAMGHFFHHTNKLGLRMRTAMMGVIYRKITRVTQFSGGIDHLAHPTNLLSVDTQRLMDLTSYINQIWEIPLQIGLAIYLLWRTLGPSAFAGLGVIVISVPLGAGTAVWIKKLQVDQMKAKDDRITLTGEVFRSIKMLKLNAWEEPFQKRVTKFRNQELKALRTIQFLQAFSTFFSMVSPLLIAIVTFATYVLIDSQNNVLDSSKAFIALSIFNILKGPMNMLPPTMGSIVQAWVSTQRLTKAFAPAEPDHYVQAITAKFLDGNSLLQIKSGQFGWSGEGPECLKQIDIAVRKGQLVGIVGQAGSGKTALCRAMLGLMNRRAGTVTVKGNICYMPQQSWLQSRSIRDNITFGRPFVSNVYETVVEKCCLMEDLRTFTDGDDTVLSDQGSNLSGGQKQRVCLARTVYSYAEIFLMDDPLSALDAKVAKDVFDNVLGPNGLLKDKARIIVMNNYRFLAHCDQLIVMENGSILEVGSFYELLNRSGPFADFLHNHLRQEIEALHEEELEPSEAAHRHEAFKEMCQKLPKNMRHSLKLHKKSMASFHRSRNGSTLSRVGTFSGIQQRLNIVKSSSQCDAINIKNHVLFEAEKSNTGRSVCQIFVSFIRNITVGIFCSIILTNALSTGFLVGSGIWLSEWSEDNMTMANGLIDTTQRDFRLGVYAALGGLQALFFYLSMMFLAYGLVRASKVLHHRMLHHLLRAPMWFFDTTPLGRITNRFSKDIDAVDVNVPQSLRQCLNSVFNILATVTILIYSYPLLAAFMVPLVLIYLAMQYFYVATSRQLKELEATTRSPIFSHLQETLTGAEIIHNFKQQHRFIREFDSYLDGNNRLTYLSLVAQRWLSVRLELMGNLIVFITAILAVYGRGRWVTHSGHVGLSITYAVQVTHVLSWFVQKASDLEMSFISVERVKEYTRCPQEAPWTIEKTRPSANWPSSGLIELRNYKTKYRPDLDLTLKGLNCRIHPDEKIGIVGRTGAGKSSLSLGIFRIVEPFEGTILIDGTDISKLGLHDLRSKITIIPQDPLLLSGSLRENLDPTNSFSDAQIWKALEATQLKPYVQNLTGLLNHPVSEGGSNLSTGQRQLICLSRAILKKSKILILDEATASLDAETDEIVQKTIQEEFVDCTVLIIAHRIQSVMDCDRVMVLDKGQIEEFDSPNLLLKNEHSAFRSLVEDSNLLKDADRLSSVSENSTSSNTSSAYNSSASFQESPATP